MLCMRFIFENILRLNLWPNISSLLENVPRALEKNVYVVAIESSVLPECVRPGGLLCSCLFLCVSSVCLYPLLGDEGADNPSYYCRTVCLPSHPIGSGFVPSAGL